MKQSQLRIMKEELWYELQKKVKVCKKCQLCKSRIQAVFGEGPVNTKLVFIGEAPGAEEDAQGRPFVGRAGQLLTKILESVGIKRQEVFITNVVKCRPPNNRVPTIEEMKACDEYLQAQIALINPGIIVCLGSTPTRWILKINDGITKIRGRWFDWKGIKVMPMFHPSYLLRNPTKKRGGPRHLTWLDIQEVKRVWNEIKANKE